MRGIRRVVVAIAEAAGDAAVESMSPLMDSVPLLAPLVSK